MAFMKSGVQRVRMPSTRWQRYGGSDEPLKTEQQDIRSDRPKASADMGNPFSKDVAAGPATVGKRQYLKTGKYVGMSMGKKFRNV